MFCMGCGAEASPQATACSVCGRDLGRGGAESRATAQAETRVASSERAGAVAAAVPAAPSAHAAPTGPTPSIGTGDLDQLGFPRDALGRALIFTVLALVADLLAPWVNLAGTRLAPSAAGWPVFLAVVVFGLAVVPVVQPRLRAVPLYAAAPLVIGAASFGLAAAVWLRVEGMSLVAPSAANSAGSGGSVLAVIGPLYSAEIGLYLFLIGAVVLVVTGYQLLVAAARGQVIAELSTAERRTLAASSAAPLAYNAAPSIASRSMPAGATTPALTASAAQPLPPTPPPLPPEAVPAPPLAAPAGGAPTIALPGSAAWSQTPDTPTFQRPSPAKHWGRRP
ncbi:MAG: hypothetical protein ACHQ4H_02435 [Ktedonobacterales bacterium]